MGGSSSKSEKKEKNKNEENIIHYIPNKENENLNIENKNEKNITFIKENNNNNINILEEKTKNDDNISEKDLNNNNNNIEELTLDKNGILLNNNINNNNSNSSLTKIITIEISNNQNEISKIKNIDNNISEEIHSNEDRNTADEETIIFYTEKVSQDIIINFYDKMIDIIYNFSYRKNFINLVKDLNEEYIININIKKFPKTKETNDFFYCMKYSSIIIICLIFLTKDLDLYENTKKKLKDNLEQFIYMCLEQTNKDVIYSLKILNFLNYYRKIKKNLYNCTNQIIKILFKNRSIYINILNCLEQLLNKINILSLLDIINKINNTILFYYNAITYNNTIIENNNNNIIITKRAKSLIKNKLLLKNESSFNSSRILSKNSFLPLYNNYNGLTQKRNKTRNKIKLKTLDMNQTKLIINNNNINITPPYIKEPLNKKFVLVLDIDETITHLIKLPFGNYFLIRPGVIDLLKELNKFYEINIFTAALQHYADNILDKLDKNGIYFSHRLYRCHCNWEEGKSIKKLELIGRDLNKIAFVDDIERNAKYNMKNLILVTKWSDNLFDEEIINIKNKLKLIAESNKYDNDITQGLFEEKLSKEINNG